MSALGIDVGGARKGYDLVLLDTARRVVDSKRHATLGDISALIEEHRPGVVAIDSPPGWAVDDDRKTETALFAIGMQLYKTPWLPASQAKPFYNWMTHGFAAFDVTRAGGYSFFDGSSSVTGCVFETFPHAIATILHQSKRPSSMKKHVWRRQALQAHGVDAAQLRGNDQVDAGLCALTGLMALEGCYTWCGDPAEGVIVLPCAAAELPARLPWASARAIAIMAQFR